MRSALRLQAVLKTSSKLFLFLLLAHGWLHVASVCPQNQRTPCRCTERPNEVQIWCSYGDLNSISSALEAIAQNLPSVVDELILENNLLPSLPDHTFPSFKVLRLMLRDNGLQKVSADWLSGTESTIQEIYIVEPELRVFPDESLVTLPRLEALTLSAGLITKMPAIFGLSRLRYIQIEAPSIGDVFSNNFLGIPFLEEMHITSGQNIRALNAEFVHDLPKLAVLNFTNSHLMFIHSKAFQRLPSVKEVSFAKNKFIDARLVGMAIRDLPNLATIRLDGNNIIRLEEGSFVDIPSLRHLYLNDNKITHIHRASFHRLSQLRTLDLRNNLIRTIHPEGFLPYRGNPVEELWLSNNQIDQSATVHMLLDTLPNLRYLDLSNNLIPEIASGTAVNHLHLEMLILENNRITRIGRESFSGLPSLRELRLRNNFIGYHLGTPYWNLPALKGLDLSRNNFEHIDRFLMNGLPSLRRLDMSGNQLKAIEPATFIGSPFLEYINVSKNGLSTLNPFTFSQLQKLFELDISYNNLSQGFTGIPGNIEHLHMAGNNIMIISSASMQEFQNSALKLLDLSNNKIHKIPATSLNTFCTLRTLLLNDNSLQVLDQSAFENLPQLRVLNLANNKLILVKNESFKKLQHLNELVLSKNRLEEFEPEILSQNQNLKKLDISGNRLTEVSSLNFSSNRKIEDLDLSGNAISEFPSSIAGLSQLQRLDLKNNLLKSIPSDVFPTLSSLKELYLSGNKLKQLPSEVLRNLSNLTMVDLENNEIEQIDSDALHNLPKLVTIKLAKNKISEVSRSAFNDLPSLQSIELQENQLQNVANEAFTSCSNLLMLNMSHNQLNAIENAGLQGLKTLEALDLSHNRIKRFSDESIRDMTFLVLLKLDNNRICNIEGTPFEKMSRLRMLSLRDNKLTSLAEPTFSKLRSSILYFDIEGNPVKCSCNMLWLKSWLQEDKQHYPGPRCSDGILLVEHEMSKYNCDDSLEIIPGCDASPTSGRSSESTTVLMTNTGMTEASSTTVMPSSNKPKPLPEESEYFDPKFIEVTENNTKSVPTTKRTNNTFSHSTSEDISNPQSGTRTKLSAWKNNTNNILKGSSAFNFFGMPLPFPNLDSFWNSAISDKNQKKNGRQGLWHSSQSQTQKDGFVPVVLETGGFVPMNITLSDSKTSIKQDKKTDTVTKMPLPQTIIDEVDDFLEEIENSRSDRNISRRRPTTENNETRIIDAKNMTHNISDQITKIMLRQSNTTTYNHEPIFSVSEKTIIKLNDSIINNSESNSEKHNSKSSEISQISTSPLPQSEFLVPGGQVAATSTSSGKAVVSRVQLNSGPSPQSEDPQSFHLRLTKSSLHSPNTSSTVASSTTRNNDSISWYFANYNRTSNEPYVGGIPIKGSTSCRMHPLLPLILLPLSAILL